MGVYEQQVEGISGYYAISGLISVRLV